MLWNGDLERRGYVCCHLQGRRLLQLLANADTHVHKAHFIRKDQHRLTNQLDIVGVSVTTTKVYPVHMEGCVTLLGHD